MKHIKFCDCLKLLLSTLGISSNRLAKVINVDSSLVNRWINGKRIPSYHTDYIDNIAEFMAKNIYNTYQKQRVDNIITDICGVCNNTLNIQDQIKHMLSEAQGYSIECHQKERSEYKNKIAIKRTDLKRTATSPRENNVFKQDPYTLSANDRILTGIKSIEQASLAILEAAAACRPEQDNSIYIAYDNYYNLEIYTEDIVKAWVDTLNRVMNNGWKLVLLIRFAPDTDRTIKFMDFIKPLIPNDQIDLYYIKKYDSYVMGEELLIAPGIGALICFCSGQDDPANRALHLTAPAAINLYLSHLKMLMERTAHPLIKRYDGNPGYSNLLINTEETAGNRFLYRYCFGMMTIPEDLYLRLLKKRNISETEFEKSMELYQKRQDAFLFNIQRYQHWDIYVFSFIKDLIKDHQIYFYSYTGVVLMKMEAAEIIQHLNYIISLLETYENYHIAFYKCNPDSCICSKNIYCLVKERQSVILEIISPDPDLPEIRITTEEPMLVNGFYEYLKNIWEHIPPVNKDKPDIINWLQNEIRILQLEAQDFINS